jgi:hypothetical protein
LDALSSLTALTELVVAGMDLSGVVDAISTLTNLRVLTLRENKFGGKLDALSSLRRLTFVSIEDNMFEVRGSYTCVRFNCERIWVLFPCGCAGLGSSDVAKTTQQ